MDNVPIRIISPNFELLGEIDDYESLQFIRRFYKVGEFELHININKNNTDKLQENNLILLGSSFNKVGIIMHRESGYDQNGEPTDTLIIKGPTLKGVMSRRLIVPPVNSNGYDSQTGNIETILKAFVNNSVVNPADASRKIPQVTIAADQQRGKQDKWRSRFEILSDKLDEIGEYAKIGWDVVLDANNNAWVFDVIEGKNLITDQDILPPVIFSIDFNSIKNRKYIGSIINAKNVGYCGGKGENEDRLIQQIGEVSGLERIETFIDCSSAEDANELLTLGSQKLGELKKTESFEVQVIPEGSFIYGQDYDLGDFITAQDRKLNITMDAQIIELKEIYEVSGFSLEATLGTNIPTILDKFKNNKSSSVEIPRKLSQLENDAGLAESADIPTKVSQLQNDKNYATENQIPTSTRQIQNDSGFETTSGAQQKANVAEGNAKKYSDTGDANTLSSAKTYADNKVAGIVDSAPQTLDTLQELAKALDDDPNFATTITNLIGTKETPEGAQEKANKAEGNAKSYADSIKPTSLPANGGNANTIGNVDISRLVFGDSNTKTKSISNPGNNILPSGFYNVPQNSASGMPYNTWWHLIVNCHTGSNPDSQYNPYNLWIAQGFWDDTIYYRTITPGGSNIWRKLVNTDQVTKIVTSTTEPSLNVGDWWYKTN
ncbi:siphovirus ReqiPepy6 Gp37-like family protein [Clostridium sp. 001]|uniref:siphovirus ReqiPepy6 Gp37-like family protein n=1 Tax=Clostridium sp. 001 TaxID=1970093 RepID=UPI001C2BAB13|nr:siphovirus ReqiPepy6 Gp37-like family protein [Clostridium sp. 001]QXE20005.1 hypothetical protein B5S50_14895 [Clostridium sp. 001]